MIKIGDYNKLKVARIVDFGYYLDAETGNTSDDILLPNKSAMERNLHEGEEVDAFIYRDSKDRPIATLKKPAAKVGDIALLRVVSSTPIGSFIDFGLERDILVPMKEKLYPLKNEESYLFYIYLDKTGRIAATTDIDENLQISSSYKIGDRVTGTVYGFQTNGTAMIAVDNIYKGIVLRNEYFNDIAYGENLNLRINKIYEDGRLGLTPRQQTKNEIASLEDVIIIYLEQNSGFMEFNDNTSPEKIYDAFHVSKKFFKRSLGRLMKKGLIYQNDKGTYLKK